MEYAILISLLIIALSIFAGRIIVGIEEMKNDYPDYDGSDLIKDDE